MPTLSQRLNNPKISYFEIQQRKHFIRKLKSFKLNNAKALSVSCGDGIWDYLALKNETGIDKIIATDIVENPVSKEEVSKLRDNGCWDFVPTEAYKELPFDDNQFDIIFHQDVIEHNRKPHQFISDQFRVLKKGGSIYIGTPNILRPGNLLRGLFGRLEFPLKIGSNTEIGDYIHEQEFHEYQLFLLLEETGFKNISIDHVFLGMTFPNIMLRDFPKNRFGKTFAHYIVGTGIKE